MSKSGEPITGIIQLSDMDTPMPDNSGVGNQSPSEMPDLVGDFDRKTGTPLSGSGEPITGDIRFSDMNTPRPDDSGVGNHSDLICDLDPNTKVILSLYICSHGQWDRDSLFLAGLYMPFVSGLYPLFDDFNSVLGAEWMDVASGKNCV